MPATALNVELYLEDLEERIDDAVENELFAVWRQFSLHGVGEGLFTPQRRAASAPRVDWPTISVNEALEDMDAMLLGQMRGASDTLAGGGGAIMAVRSNYGTPIMAAPLGAELFIMPAEMSTLPTVAPIAGGADAMRAVLDRGLPSLDHPYLQRVFDMGRRFMAVKRQYPRIGRHVHLYHPDLQGPMDIVEMAFGSEFFTVLYDQPDLVHDVLDLITRLYIGVMQRWETICPRRGDGLAIHWGWVHRGTVMLRDDSAMNLSAAMFAEFVRPYEQRVLDALGGGAMHACGRVEHFTPYLAQMPGLYAFNMSQPHLNNMETIWQHTVDRGVTMIGFNRQAAEAALAAGRDLHGRVQAR
ncbi:MAG: hypothetical protein WD042_19615 [Phycisphaeraceae bacterium]